MVPELLDSENSCQIIICLALNARPLICKIFSVYCCIYKEVDIVDNLDNQDMSSAITIKL